MSNVLALGIESLVAILLACTIIYCFLLNRRLDRLNADSAVLRSTIGELVGATDSAERAIATLKYLAAESDRVLTDRLGRADRMSAEIADQISAGESIIQRITAIVQAGRASAPIALAANAVQFPTPSVPPPRQLGGTAAAAQALVERVRERVAVA